MIKLPNGKLLNPAQIIGLSGEVLDEDYKIQNELRFSFELHVAGLHNVIAFKTREEAEAKHKEIVDAVDLINNGADLLFDKLDWISNNQPVSAHEELMSADEELKRREAHQLMYKQGPQDIDIHAMYDGTHMRDRMSDKEKIK